MIIGRVPVLGSAASLFEVEQHSAWSDLSDTLILCTIWTTGPWCHHSSADLAGCSSTQYADDRVDSRWSTVANKLVKFKICGLAC